MRSAAASSQKAAAPAAHVECVVRKKPSPKASKPWEQVKRSLQDRLLVTRGCHVDYFQHPLPRSRIGGLDPGGAGSASRAPMLISLAHRAPSY